MYDSKEKTSMNMEKSFEEQLLRDAIKQELDDIEIPDLSIIWNNIEQKIEDNKKKYRKEKLKKIAISFLMLFIIFSICLISSVDSRTNLMHLLGLIK